MAGVLPLAANPLVSVLSPTRLIEVSSPRYRIGVLCTGMHRFRIRWHTVRVVLLRVTPAVTKSGSKQALQRLDTGGFTPRFCASDEEPQT